MRQLSQSVLDVLNSKKQIWGTETGIIPKISCTRPSNDMFKVVTVNTKTGLTEIDTTLKRMNTALSPSEAFIIYIQDGVAKTYTQMLPVSTDEEDWIEQFSVGIATDVACEFDGAWLYSPTTKYGWNFVTEEFPWLFWVDATGALKAQKWDDETTLIELSTSVEIVRAVRGWFASEDGSYNDQGLIVSYVKADGNPYYRTFAKQLDQSKQWEIERVIPLLPTPIDNLALMRTNDFRVAFIAEVAGNMHWVLTTRNWSAMSIRRERITANIQDVTFEVHPIVYTDTFETEHISAETSELVFNVCPFDYDYSDITILTAKRISTNQIKLTFSHDILNGEGQQALFTVQNNTVTATGYGSDSKQITLIVSTALPATGAWDVVYTKQFTGLKAFITSTCKPHIESFTVIATGEPPNHIENLTALVTPTFAVSKVTYLNVYETENISAKISGITFVVTNVGGNPL